MAFSYQLVCLFVFATLGIQVLAKIRIPLAIINLSPNAVEVDMTGDEACLEHDFGPDALNQCYEAYASIDLGATYGDSVAKYNDNLQGFKQHYGVSDLGTKTATFSGTYTIRPWHYGSNPDFVTLGVQGITSWTYTCDTRDRTKPFTITVNETQGQYTLLDPWNHAEWALTENSPSGQSVDLVAGESILADVVASILVIAEAVLVAAVVISVALTGGAEAPVAAAALGEWGSSFTFTEGASITDSAFGSYGTLGQRDDDPTTSRQIYSFTGGYDAIPTDQRNACVLHEYTDSEGNSDCLAAGLAIIIQANGQPLPVPLPSVGGAGGGEQPDPDDEFIRYRPRRIRR